MRKISKTGNNTKPYDRSINVLLKFDSTNMQDKSIMNITFMHAECIYGGCVLCFTVESF